MAKSVFIICAESSAVDDEGKTLSLFNILEKVQFHRLPKPQPEKSSMVVVDAFRMRIVSVWLQEEGDQNETFECETFAVIPPSDLKIDFPGTTFKFGLPFQRTVVFLRGILPFQGSGTMWVTSRIRKIGTEPWVSQSFPILLEELKDSPVPVEHNETSKN